MYSVCRFLSTYNPTNRNDVIDQSIEQEQMTGERLPGDIISYPLLVARLQQKRPGLHTG